MGLLCPSVKVGRFLCDGYHIRKSASLSGAPWPQSGTPLQYFVVTDVSTKVAFKTQCYLSLAECRQNI